MFLVKESKTSYTRREVDAKLTRSVQLPWVQRAKCNVWSGVRGELALLPTMRTAQIRLSHGAVVIQQDPFQPMAIASHGPGLSRTVAKQNQLPPSGPGHSVSGGLAFIAFGLANTLAGTKSARDVAFTSGASASHQQALTTRVWQKNKP